MVNELLSRRVDDIARASGYSGVVRIDDRSGNRVARAYGFADRRCGIANSISTRFGIASGVKGMTALTVMSLVETGELALGTPVRSLLGDDLPLIDDRVTIQHLLAHRSGIGDYLDESAGGDISDHVLPVPVHRLAETEDYLGALDGHPQLFSPGERFEYCNGGFVVLALLAERASGVAFRDLMARRVLAPAGMASTSFLRSDELPGDAAVGYLDTEGLRSNVLHLPLRGSGDGGLYSTTADLHAFWASLFSGAIVSRATLSAMIRPVSDDASSAFDYGLGFWLTTSGSGVVLEGYDAGVSFRSSHDEASESTWTVISNTSSGAWNLLEHLGDLL